MKEGLCKYEDLKNPKILIPTCLSVALLISTIYLFIKATPAASTINHAAKP